MSIRYRLYLHVRFVHLNCSSGERRRFAPGRRATAWKRYKYTLVSSRWTAIQRDVLIQHVIIIITITTAATHLKYDVLNVCINIPTSAIVVPQVTTETLFVFSPVVHIINRPAAWVLIRFQRAFFFNAFLIATAAMTNEDTVLHTRLRRTSKT